MEGHHPHYNECENDAWEAGYLQALNHAVQITNDEQLKDMLKEMTIRFAVNNATRWE